jgi:hypothetical protein
MDPITALLAAAFLGGFAGESQAAAPFYGCEVEQIAGTNAYQFADPTCPAVATYNTTDYITVDVLDDEGNKIGETEVATNNR